MSELSRRTTGAHRRDMILAAARDAFLTAGYAGARTRDIAERAGITEAVIYRHFSSKRELFEQAILTPLEEWMASMPAAVESVRTATSNAERLKVTQAVNTHLLATACEIVPLLGLALFSDVEEGRAFYRRRLVPFLAELTERVGRSMEGWEHRDVDPEVWVMTAWGFCLAAASDAHLQGTPLDAEATAERLVDILVGGVARRYPSRAPATDPVLARSGPSPAAGL